MQENRERLLVSGDMFSAVDFSAHHHLPPRGCTSRRQLVITYAGAFEFQVGRSSAWVDPSRLLFVEMGQDYVDHHRIPGVGHSSIFLAPDEALLDELSTAARPAFSDRLRGCPIRTQMLVQLLRRTSDRLAAEEIGTGILLESLGEPERAPVHDTRCVRQAKAMLHDLGEDRLTLNGIARELGVSPIYLTQAFKRAEGVPLYRYQTHLRLGRALERLPECDDITGLALELGYSSHSHFTAVFRTRLGVTPSHFRKATAPGADVRSLLHS